LREAHKITEALTNTAIEDYQNKAEDGAGGA
jgi:hypothetical protein